MRLQQAFIEYELNSVNVEHVYVDTSRISLFDDAGRLASLRGIFE